MDKLWKITGPNKTILGQPLPPLFVRAESFDEALAAARKIDPHYSTGQVVHNTGKIEA